ncbi:hypothetical protein H7X46_25730 [Pseudonocardia sp. C8]|nr:hypothetical protein [Pseudonocardia sp. C8]
MNRPRSGPLPVPPASPAHGRDAARDPYRPGAPPGRPPAHGPAGAGAPGAQRPAPARPPVRRHAADRLPEQHPSGPLDLTPKRSGRTKAWLAVLFVLLSVAAVLLAVMILRETSPGGSRTGSLGPAPGTVAVAAGREAGGAGPAAVPRPVVAVPLRTEPDTVR